MLTFGFDRVFAEPNGTSSPQLTLPTLETAVVMSLSALLFFAIGCFGLTALFWRLYRRDDATLAAIKQPDQEESP
jgi:hypothetical protein